jgi:sigma-B regulation protein RsbU (phosphoserine phosphatase)
MQTTEDGTFMHVNLMFCTWLGVDASSLIGRRRFQDLLTMGGKIFHQTHFAPLLRMQGSISEVKLDVLHSDGSVVPIVINAIRRELRDTIVHDIAAFVARDRDKYEKELVRSRKRLEEAVAEATRLQADAKDRALFAEQMIGIVSHDLRNPLSSVVMGAAILAHEGLPPNQGRILSRITRSAERANRLIADLLDFTAARLGNGLTIDVSPVELHEVVSESVDELAPLYPGRELHHEASGSGACSADAHRLTQLVGNLVSNAMAYGTPSEPVRVTSSVEPDFFSIAVHNGGVPIPEELLPTLFQPMTRGTSTSNTARSVGLGLFIVKEIANAHGGRVLVTSTSEAGTTFSALFPRG